MEGTQAEPGLRLIRKRGEPLMETVIVGANHEGIAATNMLLDHHPDQQIVMIDQNTNISYLGCGTALWVDRQIDSYQDLFYTRKEDFGKKGASVHMETTVKGINFEGKAIFYEKKDGRTFEKSYDKLILATGSLPIDPGLPGQSPERTSFLKLFQDGQNANRLIGRMDVKHVSVIGAGYIGIEIAEATIRRRKKVKLFDTADTSLADYYDEWSTEDMDRLLGEKGIETHFKGRVFAFLGTTFAKRIITDHGDYRTDLMISTIGFRPNTVLGMDHLGLFRSGAYCVDCHQQTSDPDVYAVGDCAVIYSNALKKKTYIALVTNTIRSGIVAGRNVRGTASEETGVQGSSGTSVFGYHMVSIGLSVKAAQKNGLDVIYTDFEDRQRPGFMKKNAKVKVRVVYEEDSRRVVRAQMASTGGISMGIHMLSLAIKQEVMVDQLKLLDLFFLPHFSQPYNYITVTTLSTK